MNNIKISTILALAAAALVTAACDPFPKAPGGAPEIIRAVASGPTSEALLEGPFADLNTDIVIDDAVLNDTFYVWFNKQLDGTTVQAAPDTAGAASCDTAGSPLTNNLPATYRLCYASGSAQAGGLIFAAPQVAPSNSLDSTELNYWDVGSYTFGGTVRDYQGLPLTFQATFNVTHLPVLIEPDVYTIDLGWARDPAATAYTIQVLENDGSTPTAADLWTDVTTTAEWIPPVAGLTGNNSIFRVTGLTPTKIYWFRVLPDGVDGGKSTPAGIEMGSPPTLSARANPLDSNGNKTPNTVTLSMARARGAAYRVQLTEDTVNDPPTGWVDAVGPITTTAGVVQANPVVGNTSNPLVLNVGGLTNGTTYQARIIPEFGGVPNTPSEPVTFTISN